MDLDVSTDKLKFSALRSTSGSTYRLTLKLPYPCDGEKGKAKFDKNKKELKVTIPVIAPKYVEQDEVIGQLEDKSPVSEIKSSNNENTKSTKQNENENENDASTDKLSEKERKQQTRAKFLEQQEAKSRKERADHSKFVTKSETNHRMEFDLPEGAKLVATPPSHKPSPSSSSSPPSSSSSSSSIPSSTPPQVPVVPLFPVQGMFTASKKFMGHVPGYVFKLGEEGLGYYNDSDEVEVEEEVEVEVEVEDVIAPYDFKQLNEVITILVQVPRIDPKTVNARFTEKQLLLSFHTIKEANDDDDDVDNHQNKRHVLILNTSEPLNTDKCRFDVADKNMIVVLYKLNNGLWDTPLLSVEPNEYSKIFPLKKIKKKQIQKKIISLKNRSSSSSSNNNNNNNSGNNNELSKGIKQTLKENEDYEKLLASKESLEKAAAQNSMQSSKQVQKSQIPAVSMISSKSSTTSSSTGQGEGLTAPTAFQNTIMFELD